MASKVITKTNFITKLLGILEMQKKTTKNNYTKFFKRAYNNLKDEEIKDLKSIILTGDILKNIRKLKGLIDKLDKKSSNKNIIAYDSFFENKEGFWSTFKKYSNYFINRNNQDLEKLTIKNNIVSNTAEIIKESNLKIKRIKKSNTVLKQNKTKKKINKIIDLRIDDTYLETSLVEKFPKDIKDIKIYIDEVWYPTDNKTVSKTIESKNIGAISGIIYLGKYPDYALLPKIKTHLRTSGTKEFNNIINNKKVIPFFMPVTLPQNLNAQRYYFEILQVSIKILLGWVLPQEGALVNLNIYPEHYADYDDKLDKTELFNGILENLKLTTNRFSRFNINEVVWKDKEFEYIPYADLIGYIGLQHVEFNKKLAKSKSFDDVVINIPISLNTYKRLEKIDRFKSDKDVKNIVDLLLELKNNSLSKYILKLLKEEFIKDDNLKVNLIEVIESYYLKKIRNMNDLRILYYYFNNLINEIDIDQLLYKTQIEIILIKLQYANHEGNPKMIEGLLNSYMLIREKSKKDNRGLVLYTDLNFIVNLNDQFRFQDSLFMIDNLVNNFDFSFYSSINTGKALSSYGQVLALNGNLKKANDSFINALESFKNADLLSYDKNKELEKTKVYKVVNLINQNKKDAVIEFRELLSSSNITIKMIVESRDSEFNYIHYLLVKLIFFFNIDEKLEYLSYISSFHQNQHPCEVILLYKALLLLENDINSKDAPRMLINSIKIVDSEEHGGIIKLIGLVISLIARIYYPHEKFYKESFDNYLKIVKSDMSYAKSIIKKIELYAKDGTGNDVNDILRLLPFNYI